jgi:hypothetical protein
MKRFSVAEGDEQKNAVIVARFQRAISAVNLPGDSRRAIMFVIFDDRFNYEFSLSLS